MMTGCWVRRGLFVLRECGAPPVAVCATCARPICAQHLADPSAMLCIECLARQQQAATGDTTLATDGDVYSYRHHYYTTSHYHPIYAGPTDDAYYNDYDVRSFDREASDIADGGDESGADFLDS